MNEYNVANEGGELFDGQTIGAEQLGDYQGEFILLPEGDYEFTVVKLEESRYKPNPSSKIGPCKQVTITLRVIDPQSGRNVDLKHNLYMWTTTVGMIAQYQDSIGIHKKGTPLTFDWRPDVHIGKTGKLAIKHRTYKDRSGNDRVTNNISRLYPKEEQTTAYQQPQTPAWQRGF